MSLAPSKAAPSKLAPSQLATTVAFAALETVVVDSHRVWCDGGEGGLGHPRVYLEMGDAPAIECSYCDRRFVLSGHEHAEDPRLDPADYEGAGGV